MIAFTLKETVSNLLVVWLSDRFLNRQNSIRNRNHTSRGIDSEPISVHEPFTYLQPVLGPITSLNRS